MKKYEGVLFEPNGFKVRTPSGRALWPFILEKDKPRDSKQKAQYRMMLIFPQGTDLTSLQMAVMNAAKSEWSTGLPANFNNPIKKGNNKIEEEGLDVENDDIAKALLNSHYINVKTDYPVPVGAKINGKFVEIDNPEDIYGGMWCVVTLNARPYTYLKKTGVSLYLAAVCKTDNDSKLGLKDDPDKDFDDISDSGFTSVSPEYKQTTDEEYEKYFKQNSGTPSSLS